MSSIEINHIKSVKAEEYPRYATRMQVMQEYLRGLSGGCWSKYYSIIVLLPQRKYFASENIISVTGVEELPPGLSPLVTHLCLNNPEKFGYPGPHKYTTQSLSKEYENHVMESYPDLSVVDGVIQLFYIDVVSIDQHSERLLFLTRESAQAALTAILEAI